MLVPGACPTIRYSLVRVYIYRVKLQLWASYVRIIVVCGTNENWCLLKCGELGTLMIVILAPHSDGWRYYKTFFYYLDYFHLRPNNKIFRKAQNLLSTLVNLLLDIIFMNFRSLTDVSLYWRVCMSLLSNCWFHGPSITSAASDVVFWTFFRAKLAA